MAKVETALHFGSGSDKEVVMTKEEYDAKYGVGDGYSAQDVDLLFNPETNKSTGEVGPRFEDPVEEECCKDTVKINSMPNIKPGKIVSYGPDVCCSGSDHKPDPKTGHYAFGIRMCKGCGVMSDQAHRDDCEEYDDNPELPRMDLEIYIKKISNGYVFSFEGEQIFYVSKAAVLAKVLSIIKDME